MSASFYPPVPASFLSTSCQTSLSKSIPLSRLNRGLSFLRDTGSGRKLYTLLTIPKSELRKMKPLKTPNKTISPLKEQITTAWSSRWLTGCGLVLKARGETLVCVSDILLSSSSLGFIISTHFAISSVVHLPPWVCGCGSNDVLSMFVAF